MATEIASGNTRTVASGSTLYAREIDLSGQLDLAGQTHIGPFRATGTGTGLGTATASTPGQISAVASGIGEGNNFTTDFDPLGVASGDTFTVASGDATRVSSINLGGEINLDGEVNTVKTAVYSTRQRLTSATGTGNSSTSAVATPQLTPTASGVGEGFNYVFDFNPLSVSSTDTFTVASGDTTRVGEVNLSGELNVSGDFQTVNTSATANPQRLTSASGSGDATGSAVATPQLTPTALGVGEGTGAAVPSFEKRRVGSGDTLFIRSFDVSGELSLAGQMHLGPYKADSTGSGTGKATSNPKALKAASGVGEGVALQNDFDNLLIGTGTARTVSSGDILEVSSVSVAGEVNIAGELRAEQAMAKVSYSGSASGSGDGIGTATSLVQALLSADGTGEGEGSAVYIISIPMVRGDSTDVEYHEDDNLDLGADSDGTR